ncbi:MAG: ABC transporter ATP-binding protein [Lachnospiraceae bacterium]|nr:ABC transporter ATP-binding protein [Lachnospiraceae bacterium]
MILFENVSKTFGAVKAVQGVSFTVEDGEIVGFIGPNGSGKTTCMKMMTGILKPDEGRIEIAGHDILKDPMGAKKEIGYISDNPDQFMRLKGSEYLELISDIYGVGEIDRNKRMKELADRFGMMDALDRRILSYSHGMRQKLMVIGALIHEPKEWILDEPMTGLDPESAYELKKMMKEHAQKGYGVLFSTHVLEVAAQLCDRVVIIRYGRVMFIGTLDELQSGYPGRSLEEIFLDLMHKEG